MALWRNAWPSKAANRARRRVIRDGQELLDRNVVHTMTCRTIISGNAMALGEPAMRQIRRALSGARRRVSALHWGDYPEMQTVCSTLLTRAAATGIQDAILGAARPGRPRYLGRLLYIGPALVEGGLA